MMHFNELLKPENTGQTQTVGDRERGDKEGARERERCIYRRAGRTWW